MKPFRLVLVAVFVLTVGVLQASAQSRAKNGGATISPMVAVGSFQLGEEDRFGPMMILQYSPAQRTIPAIDLFAGVLIQTNNSGPIDENEYIPVAATFAPYYSPYSNYRNDNLYRAPRFSLGLGFIGADLTFYLAEGEVRPYVGVGGTLAFWSYSEHWSGTLAPDAKAGLSVQISSGFNGFAEVRRMFDVPNLAGIDVPRFGGVTSAALGLSFAPRLR